MSNNLPKCEHCGQTIRKSRKRKELTVIRALPSSIIDICPIDKFNDRHNSFLPESWNPDEITHLVIFNGKTQPDFVDVEKLAIPNQEVGMLILCSAASLLDRSGSTSIMYHNEQYYYLLSYLEMDMPKRGRAPEFRVDGNKCKPLKLAPAELQNEIGAAVARYTMQNNA